MGPRTSTGGPIGPTAGPTSGSPSPANRRVTLPLYRYPDCVKDYSIECRLGGSWRTVAEARENYFRRRVHRFEPVRSDRLRLTVLATNGAPAARVYEVRVYNES